MINTVSINMQKLAALPWIQLFASPACNLKCEYCSQQNVRTHGVKDDFLQNSELIEFIKKIPPTHIYLSGGEPLIHPGVKDFIAIAGKCGHKTSIDTNLHISKKRLEDYLSNIDPEWLGFINISHHLICNIKMETIDSRVRMLEDAGISHFVKYVGVPEHLEIIERNINSLKDRGTGAAVSILQGIWNGRVLPAEYTLDETVKLLNMVTLHTHGLQVFEGIYSNGIPCRGGQDFIAYNMHDDRKIIPCCHGSSSPLDIRNTFFETGERHKLCCNMEACLGDLMFICGINGVTDEIEKFEKICSGNFESPGVESVTAFIEEIRDKGYRLVNNRKFQDVQRHCTSPIYTVNAARNDNSFNANWKSGAEMITEIEKFISDWNYPENVIRDNPAMEKELRGELTRIPSKDEKVLARALGKKVAQDRFILPRKCNIEVISSCILKCEFCTLHDDLKQYRRKTRMTYEDFMKIWKYMEVFTTELEFTGGEPLLNKEVFAMIRETKKTGVYSTLTTNAQLLNKKLCEDILEAQPSRILIAFDSVRAENYESARVKGKFERLRENVIHLSQRKHEMGLEFPEINIQMVVSKKNKDEIEQFWREAVAMNVDSASIKPILVWPGSGHEFEKKMIDEYLIPSHPMGYHQVDSNGELVKPRKPGFCSNTRTVHIGSGSEVIPCWYILKDTYVAGYAVDIPFVDIWFSDEYKEYRQQMTDDTVSDACPGCIGKYEPSMFITRKVSEISEEMFINKFPETLNKSAEQKFHEGKLEETKSILLDLLKKVPDYSEALNNLGVVYLQEGDIESAVSYFQRTLEVDSNNRDALVNMIKVLSALDQMEDAKRLYSNYLKYNQADREIEDILKDSGVGEYISIGPEQEEPYNIPVVSARELHKKLGLKVTIDYPETSLNRSFDEWQMEIDDSPIFRYIYRNIRPRRHLEFGTWQGTGVLYCLEECDATIWTINLLHGENKPNGEVGYGISPSEIASARVWARKIGLPEQNSYRTDSIGFIGRRYLETGMENRVCQIYCDSRNWDTSNYPDGFFDSVLIDGGHSKDIVLNDTAKALKLIRPDGIIMWHDFCPPMIKKSEVTRGVIEGIAESWEIIKSNTRQLFWIYPSYILLGVKK